jgi:ketosteroid isomerase-like protein
VKRVSARPVTAGTTVITTEDVVRTHTEFNRALTARDFDALSKLYADDYMLVRPDGSVLSTQEVLRDLQAGGLKFSSIENANVKVRIYGQTALLTADSQTVTSRHGKEMRTHVRFLAVYVAEGGMLRLVHFQSVSLPEK